MGEETRTLEDLKEVAETMAPVFDLIQVAVVRHPADQWLSLRRLAAMKDKLTLAAYLHGYANFAERVAPLGFVQYEEFTRQPAEQAKLLCEKLHLPFDERFIERWPDYDRITGDNLADSRGASLREIRPMQRREAEAGLRAQLRDSSDYHRILELLGYEDIEEPRRT